MRRAKDASLDSAKEWWPRADGAPRNSSRVAIEWGRRQPSFCYKSWLSRHRESPLIHFQQQNRMIGDPCLSLCVSTGRR
jgi:hypothetical protein